MLRRLLALSLLLTLSACVRNPVTGRRQLSLVSTRDEIAIGQQAAEDARQSIGLLPDPSVQEYVARVGKSLAATSERPDLPWSFQVLDDPTVNAFALPGGPIFLTGLRYMLNERYDVREMLDVFRTLSRVSGSEGSRLPGWLSTHPHPEDRLKETQRRLAALSLDPATLREERARYLRLLQDMPYGQNPRQG